MKASPGVSSQIGKNYEDVKTRIRNAVCERPAEAREVNLIAISKSQPVEKIQALYDLGHRNFGENYADELIEKSVLLKTQSIRWSFVGRLQSNKIRKIVSAAAEIQSAVSEKHVRLIAQAAAELGKTPYPIYLALNFAREPQKGGIQSLGELLQLSEKITEHFPSIQLRGVMAIPPLELIDEDLDRKKVFAHYQELYHASQQVGSRELSLGMSRDLEYAISCGSTTIRIGEALFGRRDRPYKPS